MLSQIKSADEDAKNGDGLDHPVLNTGAMTLLNGLTITITITITTTRIITTTTTITHMGMAWTTLYSTQAR
jgi:uncharacterized membrane-anchored protein